MEISPGVFGWAATLMAVNVNATYQKFDQFVQDLVDGKHKFVSDTFKVMLTNTLPVRSNTVKANLSDISAGAGYTAGGLAVAITEAQASGLSTVKGPSIVFKATANQIGPFRYAALYNDSAAGKPLVGWWDFGVAVTLLLNQAFTIVFDTTTGIFQIQ